MTVNMKILINFLFQQQKLKKEKRDKKCAALEREVSNYRCYILNFVFYLITFIRTIAYLK